MVLGVGGFGVSLPDAGDGHPDPDERADRWMENSIRTVAVRARSSRAARDEATDLARADRSAPEAAATATVAAPPVRPAARAPAVSADRVDAPLVAVALRGERRERERLSATDLAGMFPGGDETPRPTSRAAREVSGEHRDVGDRFRGLGGTQRVARRGGGCTVTPGTIIDRRFPRGVTPGGG